MKVKILWAEADRIHRIITRDLKEGKIKLSKKAKLDVDKVPHSVIEYMDKNAMAMALGAAAVIGFLAMMIIGDMVIGLSTMLAAMLVALRLAVSKKIIFPFFFAKWVSCTPFDMSKAKPAIKYTVKEKVETQEFKKDGTKKSVWKTIKTKYKDIGTLEFFEVKMQEKSDGIPIFTPENYELMDKNTALKEIIKGEHKENMNIWLIIIGIMLGVFIGLYFAPFLTQALTPAAAPAAAAATGG